MREVSRQPFEQVSYLANSAPEPVQAAVWIALLTDCLRGEILKMRAVDIGRDTVAIHSGNTRTRRTRVISIAPGMRHCSASVLMGKGADLYTVSEILGHSTITTTQRHAHLEVSQQRAALKRGFG